MQLPPNNMAQVVLILPSRAWSCWCGVWYVPVTGGAGAGPGREEYLQLADDSVEAQAGAVSFGDRVSR